MAQPPTWDMVGDPVSKPPKAYIGETGKHSQEQCCCHGSRTRGLEHSSPLEHWPCWQLVAGSAERTSCSSSGSPPMTEAKFIASIISSSNYLVRNSPALNVLAHSMCCFTHFIDLSTGLSKVSLQDDPGSSSRPLTITRFHVHVDTKLLVGVSFPSSHPSVDVSGDSSVRLWQEQIRPWHMSEEGCPLKSEAIVIENWLEING